MGREIELLKTHGYTFIPEELGYVKYNNLRNSVIYWKDQGVDLTTRRILIENSVPGPTLQNTNSGWFVPGKK